MKLSLTTKVLAPALTLALVLTGCNATAPTVGSSKADVAATGSAGGASSQGANSTLERCASPLGTVALVEETSADWYRLFTTEYKLQTVKG